jgi:hypothetical protein
MRCGRDLRKKEVMQLHYLDPNQMKPNSFIFLLIVQFTIRCNNNNKINQYFILN